MDCEVLVEIIKSYIDGLKGISFSDVLSFVAIIISLLVFFKDWLIYKKKLKVTLLSVETSNIKPDDETYYNAIAYCVIENQNQYPITITSVYLGNYKACKLSYSLYGDSIPVFGQEPSYDVNSLKLPYSLDGFKAAEITAFIFLSTKPIVVNEDDKMLVNTTRGNIEIEVNKYLNVNVEDDTING